MSVGHIARRHIASKLLEAAAHTRANAIYDGATAKQRRLIDETAKFIGVLCPRRSGKTFGVLSKALHLMESVPGARVLIISLTLKSTVENYWSGAPGGLFFQSARYELNLKFNATTHTWVHPNGSRGLLAGAETKSDIEHLRGAAAEADLVIVDECKSFAPAHLNDLVENVIEPGLMTRSGRLILAGTPGSIPLGPFYAATCTRSRTPTEEKDTEGYPTCIHEADRNAPGPAYARIPADAIEDLYILHTWNIQDNTAKPEQWRNALSTKRRRGWSDDHPTWRREYLGEWVTDTSELVYAFAGARHKGVDCTWRPDLAFGPTGLDPAQGPWHLLLGLDLGFVDDSAMVLVAYSETLSELRHVYDFKAPGLDSQAFAMEVLDIIDQYGVPNTIVADFGGGGAKMLLENINQRYGLGIIPAQKRDKNDHIDLINGDFGAGRIKIQANSDLDNELCGLQWDLSNGARQQLARTNRLREDPRCPNHLCDALLYIWRYSFHFFGHAAKVGPDKGTKEYEDAQEAAAMARVAARHIRTDPHGLRRLAEERPFTRETVPWMKPTQKQPTRPTSLTLRTCVTSLVSFVSSRFRRFRAGT